MKLLSAVLISTVVGIVPALAQTSSTFTTTPTSDGSRSSTTWSDGSSATTTTSGSRSTTTYQPPGHADFAINNGNVTIKAAPAMTKEELEIFKAKQAEWGDRCRPMFVEDAYGIRRAQYAEKDCDLSQFNTAGVR
jgi:hypothetical protein